MSVEQHSGRPDGRDAGRDVVHVHPDRPALAAACADALLERLAAAVAEHGRADVALTGGGAGIAVVAALASAPGAEDLDWSRIHLWWGDERWLPAGDAERNDHQARQAGLDALMARTAGTPRALTEATVHPFPAAGEGLDLDAAAVRACAELTPLPRFTVVLLGMGPDSHVASLFPGHEGLQVAGVPAAPVRNSPKPPDERLTLTREAIGAADEVWFTVAGPDKAEAVAAVRARRERGVADEDHPATLVSGTAATVWWLDEAACGS